MQYPHKHTILSDTSWESQVTVVISNYDNENGLIKSYLGIQLTDRHILTCFNNKFINYETRPDRISLEWIQGGTDTGSYMINGKDFEYIVSEKIPYSNQGGDFSYFVVFFIKKYLLNNPPHGYPTLEFGYTPNKDDMIDLIVPLIGGFSVTASYVGYEDTQHMIFHDSDSTNANIQVKEDFCSGAGIVNNANLVCLANYYSVVDGRDLRIITTPLKMAEAWIKDVVSPHYNGVFTFGRYVPENGSIIKTNSYTLYVRDGLAPSNRQVRYNLVSPNSKGCPACSSTSDPRRFIHSAEPNSDGVWSMTEPFDTLETGDYFFTAVLYDKDSGEWSDMMHLDFTVQE